MDVKEKTHQERVGLVRVVVLGGRRVDAIAARGRHEVEAGAVLADVANVRPHYVPDANCSNNIYTVQWF